MCINDPKDTTHLILSKCFEECKYIQKKIPMFDINRIKDSC